MRMYEEAISRCKPHVMHRRRDHYSSWYCLDCGARGSKKEEYKSSLKTRRRAHLNCRCKKNVKD